MALSDILKIGNPIEVTVREGPWAGYYLSRVEEVSGSTVVIAALLRDRNVVPLQNGDYLHISYSDGTKLYVFDAPVEERLGGNVPRLLLGRHVNLQEMQRRNFVRLNVKLPLTIALLDENFEPQGQTFKGETVDISGGGLKLRTETPLAAGSTIDIVLPLPDRQINAIASVIRVEEFFHNHQKEFLAGLEFTIIQEAERDKIIGYIFTKQRELRSKRFI